MNNKVDYAGSGKLCDFSLVILMNAAGIYRFYTYSYVNMNGGGRVADA